MNTNALEFDYSSAVPNIQFIRDEGDHVPEGVEKTVVAMHAGPFSEQFNNNIAEYFHYYLKEMPDLQFCVYGHGHNVSVDEFSTTVSSTTNVPAPRNAHIYFYPQLKRLYL